MEIQTLQSYRSSSLSGDGSKVLSISSRHINSVAKPPRPVPLKVVKGNFDGFNSSTTKESASPLTNFLLTPQTKSSQGINFSQESFSATFEHAKSSKNMSVVGSRCDISTKPGTMVSLSSLTSFPKFRVRTLLSPQSLNALPQEHGPVTPQSSLPFFVSPKKNIKSMNNVETRRKLLFNDTTPKEQLILSGREDGFFDLFKGRESAISGLHDLEEEANSEASEAKLERSLIGQIIDKQEGEKGSRVSLDADLEQGQEKVVEEKQEILVKRVVPKTKRDQQKKQVKSQSVEARCICAKSKERLGNYLTKDKTGSDVKKSKKLSQVVVKKEKNGSITISKDETPCNKKKPLKFNLQLDIQAVEANFRLKEELVVSKLNDVNQEEAMTQDADICKDNNEKEDNTINFRASVNKSVSHNKSLEVAQEKRRSESVKSSGKISRIDLNESLKAKCVTIKKIVKRSQSDNNKGSESLLHVQKEPEVISQNSLNDQASQSKGVPKLLVIELLKQNSEKLEEEVLPSPRKSNEPIILVNGQKDEKEDIEELRLSENQKSMEKAELSRGNSKVFEAICRRNEWRKVVTDKEEVAEKHKIFKQGATNFFEWNMDNKFVKEYSSVGNTSKNILTRQEPHISQENIHIDTSNKNIEDRKEGRGFRSFSNIKRDTSTMIVRYFDEHDPVVIQPKFMEANGSMCVTELWGQGQKQSFYKKMRKTLTSDPVLCLDSHHGMYRPEKGPDSQSLKRRREGNTAMTTSLAETVSPSRLSLDSCAQPIFLSPTGPIRYTRASALQEVSINRPSTGCRPVRSLSKRDSIKVNIF